MGAVNPVVCTTELAAPCVLFHAPGLVTGNSQLRALGPVHIG